MSQDDSRYRGGAGRPAPRRPTLEQAPGAEAALAALAARFGVPAVDVAHVSFPMSNLALIPVEIARRQCVLPILVRDDAIFLAMGDPSERRVIDELEFVSGKRVFPYVAEAGPLAQAIEAAYQLRDHGGVVYTGPRAGEVGRAGTAAAERLGATPGVAARVDPLHFGGGEIDDLELPGASAPPAPPGAPTLDSVFTTFDQIRGQTVLVVDDEEDIRKLLRRVLEGKGYRVLDADRGSVALSLVKQHMPDAIILDAMLPELHGFDICRRIKASARYGHIPILMISAVYRGWRFAEDLKSSYGVNSYLEKPFRIAELLTAVEALLAGAPRADGRDPEALTAEADAALAAGMNAYKKGDLGTAIAHIERGIQLDPLAYRLHYHLALLLGRNGDVFRAIQELETTINLNPQSFPALKNLAVLYQQAGFRNKAIEMWERAIGQSPDEQTRGQIKEHLMSLL